MPCTYEETPEEIAQSAKQAEARRNRELNKVTDLLCKVMTALDEAQEDENCTTSEDVFNIIGGKPSVQVWWSDHKKRDVIREKKEAREVVKKKALQKLTLEEKRVLGLTK